MKASTHTHIHWHTSAHRCAIHSFKNCVIVIIIVTLFLLLWTVVSFHLGIHIFFSCLFANSFSAHSHSLLLFFRFFLSYSLLSFIYFLLSYSLLYMYRVVVVVVVSAAAVAIFIRLFVFVLFLCVFCFFLILCLDSIESSFGFLMA